MNKLIMIIMVVLIFMLTSCSVPISEPTPTPTQTAASTIAPTPKPTPTPTPEPTPEPTLSPEEIQAQREAEINKEIHDFLKAEGEYQDYKIIMGTLKPYAHYPYTYKLGLTGYTGVMGCLLGFVEQDEHILLIAGFQDKEELRFVTALDIPMYFIEGSANDFIIHRGGYVNPSPSSKYVKSSDRQVILEKLTEMKGHICVFYLAVQEFTSKQIANAEKRVEEAEDTEKEFQELGFRYLNDLNDKSRYSKALFSKVFSNGETAKDSYGNTASKGKPSDVNVIEEGSIDISTINDSNLPLINYIVYK